MGGEPEKEKPKDKDKPKEKEKEEKPKPASQKPKAAEEKPKPASQKPAEEKPKPASSKDAEAPKKKVEKAAAPKVDKPGVAAKPAKAVPKSGAEKEGLSDEMMTHVAQAKFDAQEERLRDVARHTMTLLRDHGKFSEAECTKKATEVQKLLLKYETQYIRALEYQERRRKREVEDLEKEAARCGKEAEEEGERIVELREILEQEKQRRKRYERYEELAETVCRKAARTESQAEIEACKQEILETRRKRQELEAFMDQRQLRAQLLTHAVVELRGDLKREQALCGQDDVADAPPSPEPAGEQDDRVEVIS